ncbi:hypothetical protein MesoLj131b_12060 [Mesorhizobium sp. 131-2-5]|uniref:hypothetical protein n=1 Tax=Mesorhizobium sp. 131-2-5 TaxID=2744519 RepID=UPI0019254B17|nr:hypothetical protein [Mesorhizobium sp. 131-2-5]BCG99206.1 hypothetical protein MesoLj131b_12060 [Mesorhizobium sp. 131-2-5]
MNMIAPIRSADARNSIFGRLQTLIASRPASPDAARAEARHLISLAMADTWQADGLWGAADAFHAHFDFMMQTIEINGADDPNLRTLRTKCRVYLDQVEALCQSMSH